MFRRHWPNQGACTQTPPTLSADMNFSASLLVLFLAVMMTACNEQTDSSHETGAQKMAGMSDFDYLACDGGPHLVLPKELSRQWKGGNALNILSSSSDYGRACAATTNKHMALITVGSGQAMLLANPPLSAWGRSPEGWVDIYDLQAWADTNTDAMIKRAIAATPTTNMTDTGKTMALKQPGLILLFAGDRPGNTAYGEYPIPLASGSYRIWEGHHKGGTNEEIYVYRFQPKGS